MFHSSRVWADGGKEFVEDKTWEFIKKVFRKSKVFHLQESMSFRTPVQILPDKTAHHKTSRVVARRRMLEDVTISKE